MAHAAHPAPTPDAAHAHGDAHAEHHGSFWPLILTVFTSIFLIGLLAHGTRADGTPWDQRLLVSGLGFLGIAFSVGGWIREDVHELRGKPYQIHGSDYLFGTIVLICSEVVIFGVLFTFYFWSRWHTPDFIPEAIREMSLTPILINTVLLISSGATVEVAKARLKRADMRGFQIWLGITLLLGTLFVAGQVREYLVLMSEGVTIQSSVYGTAFYSLTGVHGLHVVAGLVVLGIIFGLSFTGFAVKERLSGMEGAFIYWHFVDGIWIVVFLVIYLRVI